MRILNTNSGRTFPIRIVDEDSMYVYTTWSLGGYGTIGSKRYDKEIERARVEGYEYVITDRGKRVYKLKKQVWLPVTQRMRDGYLCNAYEKLGGFVEAINYITLEE